MFPQETTEKTRMGWRKGKRSLLTILFRWRTFREEVLPAPWYMRTYHGSMYHSQQVFCYLQCVHKSTFFFGLRPFYIVIEDDWLQIMRDIYNEELIKFMHFRDNTLYSRGHEFTTDYLLIITPRIRAHVWTFEVTKRCIQTPLHAQFMHDCRHWFFSKKQCLLSCLGIRWFGIPFEKKSIHLSQAK